MGLAAGNDLPPSIPDNEARDTPPGTDGSSILFTRSINFKNYGRVQ